MNASLLAAANLNAPAITAGSKAGAILIGAAFLVVLYFVTAHHRTLAAQRGVRRIRWLGQHL
jgi:hypothetical protein